MDKEIGGLLQGFQDIKETVVNGFSDVKEGMHAQDIEIKEIKKEVKATNGKVRWHDFFLKAVIGCTGVVIGAIAGLSPIISDYVSEKLGDEFEKRQKKNFEEFDARLDERLDEILSTYEFEVTK